MISEANDVVPKSVDEPDVRARAMFVARLCAMQTHGQVSLTIAEVLALLDDCDMLAQRGAV